jgi:hypothetical protein
MCFSSGGQQNTSATDAANAAAIKRQNELFEQQLADQKTQADEARRISAEKQNRLREGMANIQSGFAPYDENYFNQFSQKYLDNYTPQLDDQYEQAKKQLAFGLSRSGISQSQAAGEEMAKLEKAYGLKRQDMISGAKNYANNARTQIENQRSQLLNQLSATGGEEATAAAFLGKGNGNSVGSLPIQAPQLGQFSALGDLFGNLSQVAVNDTRVSNAMGRDGLLQSAFRTNSGNKNASSYIE